MPAVLSALLAALISLAPEYAAALGKSEPLHPGFTFERRDLPSLATGVTKETAGRIAAAPREFLELLRRVMDGSQDLVVLVDKAHSLAKTSEPPDLVPLAEDALTQGRSGLRLREMLIADLRAMAEAARVEGVTLQVSSAYRSYQYQEKLFADDLKKRSREEVLRDLAQPGHSQHQLGTAMDFGSIDPSFAATPAGRWLLVNALRFGFSLSYPDGQERVTGYAYEPWHYRYVGRDAASLIGGFFGGSQQDFLAWYADRHSFLAAHRRNR